MDQSWVSVAGIIAEIAGLASAALGTWRSQLQYRGTWSEPWWAPAGLGVAAAGLLAQLVDLTLL